MVDLVHMLCCKLRANCFAFVWFFGRTRLQESKSCERPQFLFEFGIWAAVGLFWFVLFVALSFSGR